MPEASFRAAKEGCIEVNGLTQICEGEDCVKVNDGLSELPRETQGLVKGSRDRLSELPDDILLSILTSVMSVKEAARLSVVSCRWSHLWRCFPVMALEDKRAMDLCLYTWSLLGQERSTYLRWADHVVDKHVAGSSVDELRVVFDLDSSCQTYIDKWVVFALENNVKTLELDLTPVRWENKPNRNCKLPPEVTCLIKPCLTSLSLRSVNVTTEQIDSFLHLCPFLEKLCIERSSLVTILRVSGSSLKHLEVNNCSKLKSLDVDAPKLESFTHYGRPMKLNIRNAAMVREVSMGGVNGRLMQFVVDSLSKHFSKLEFLSLLMCFYQDLNLVIKHPPALTNLKHLDLRVYGMCHHSLLGWVSLIEASPNLEKISLKMNYGVISAGQPIVVRNGCTLKCLKTLELVGFQGQRMDLEFAAYVFRNAVVLREVVVDFIPYGFDVPLCEDVESCFKIKRYTASRC